MKKNVIILEFPFFQASGKFYAEKENKGKYPCFVCRRVYEFRFGLIRHVAWFHFQEKVGEAHEFLDTESNFNQW